MRSSTWFGRRARLTVALGLTLVLVLSTTLVAFAAPINIAVDPFTQATCNGSATTNHHANVEPDSFSLAPRSSPPSRLAASTTAAPARLASPPPPTMAPPEPAGAAGRCGALRRAIPW